MSGGVCLRTVLQAWSRARERRRRAARDRSAALQLRGMDDHELDDLGIARGDLARIAPQGIFAALFFDATMCERGSASEQARI